MSYAIPEELTYEQISMLYPSTKSEYRRNPTNNTTFANGVDMNMPLNKMANSFANPATLVLNFEVAYTLTSTVAVGGANLNAGDGIFVLGNAYSHFSRQVLKAANGGTIETIDNPSLAVNALMNMTTSKGEKQALINMGFGTTNNETNAGIKITAGALAPQATTVVYRTYTIPIIGALNTSKFIPLYVSDMELIETLNNPANFIISSSANLTCTFTIQNVEIVYDVLTLEEAGFKELTKSGMIQIKTTSYKYGSSVLQASAPAGSYDIIYAHQVSSLKKFIWWCSPANNWEGQYGGVNPNLTDWCLVINSTTYPQQRVKVPKVSECVYQNSKAFGSVYSTSHSGSYNRDSFAKCSVAGTATTNREYSVYAPALATAPAPTLANLQGETMTSAMSNKWYQALDLEKINQLKNEIYSGLSSKGSTNTFSLNVGVALAAQIHNINYFTEYDALINFDAINGIISVSD
jgi:hypothetical protein